MVLCKKCVYFRSNESYCKLKKTTKTGTLERECDDWKKSKFDW